MAAFSSASDLRPIPRCSCSAAAVRQGDTNPLILIAPTDEQGSEKAISCAILRKACANRPAGQFGRHGVSSDVLECSPGAPNSQVPTQFRVLLLQKPGTGNKHSANGASTSNDSKHRGEWRKSSQLHVRRVRRANTQLRVITHYLHPDVFPGLAARYNILCVVAFHTHDHEPTRMICGAAWWDERDVSLRNDDIGHNATRPAAKWTKLSVNSQQPRPKSNLSWC
ncbi:uncharacterized protein BDZ83DRAFT_98839 [Colletotrichum acutatum]|uniref:Uncharacterized protein n=1 Tax=Glomerella acutata TaxID=27357 RepID=A0AAD8UW06_GLOAC|nr:uncharacterized protein BDZ83DRAFT_98839 [Colletotrichum acutatum]KAK1728719.1 hypothetical protein BDZ83DRAFT_98839 [Colletotrichum acutatum]